MTYSTVLPIWQSIQGRFHTMVKALPEEDLSLQIGSSPIGYMIRHSAEVEYMFADWFFGKEMPEDLEIVTNRGASGSTATFTNVEELVHILSASNEHLIEAMSQLPEDLWHLTIDSPMGLSTPLEAVGRLMYHTGIHAGQISLIRKNARN